MAKFIGPTDLTYLWTKIKNYIANSSPVTSVNNQTGDVTIATGEANVIENVSFNGTAATVTNKIAAITATIPTVPSNIVTGLNSSGVAAAYTIKVVDSLPGTTDPSTIYLVTGS